jgi:cyclopropane-fatty-acyl-phospholipid synthase
MGVVARDICLSLLDRAGIPLGEDAPYALHVHDERLWDRVVADRNLGLGEAYLDGWWDCDALDVFFERILAAGVDAAIKPSLRALVGAAQASVVNRQSVRRAAHNARHHYDIGNDLYQAMLDKRMVYSCGYWAQADDLDSAQEAKLDLICRKLDLQPGVRLLDIGCGWGALAQFAAERYGAHVVGISPAANQVALARERCAGLPVEIRQCDYREVRGVFDRIVSVGMVEHVGPRNLRRLFRVCDALLGRDGIMLHHTIGSRRTKRHVDPWFDRYIFPGGVLPSIAQLGRAAEPDWVVEDVHNIGPDYDRTLMAWHANVDEAWPSLPAYDERFRRMWRYYLLSCAAGFRVRDLQLYQVVFRRAGPAPRYHAPR